LKNLIIRTITAAAFVAVLLGCTFYGPYSFSILFLIVTTLGLWEFYALIEKSGSSPQKIYGLIIGILSYITFALVILKICPPKIAYLSLPLWFSILIIELFRKKENPFRNIAVTALGLVYIAIPFQCLIHITSISGTYNYQIMFGIFFILWCYDAGAYLVGSAIGKHKLFPRISPGKTWEGSIGGAIISYGIVYIISGWYTSIGVIDWLVIATILIVIGTLGDLTESLLKRSVAMKDSGNLLPGHGGILDRFDSLIMSAPFIFCYLMLIK